ncbi:MAG TPA: hypothetical protein VLA19_10030 [Herpetosiphonaceae bacterium]|nr:hypothetical protein [Herpetosiphonaceae bacterium]
MARFGNIAGVWKTVRELNVGDIREEAEQPIEVAIVGEPHAREPLTRALRGQPGRFPLARGEAVREYDLPLRRDRPETFQRATLIILALHGDAAAPAELERAADRLSLVQTPTVVACLGGQRLPAGVSGNGDALGLLPRIFLPLPETPEFTGQVATKIVEHIPEELRLAAARVVPGIRPAVANAIIGDTALSNATFALTAGIPEMIPLLNIPLNAADMVVLTKNQALMVYRLALAFGASGDFQAQMREIMPVLGGGFAWRQVARQLIGLVPGFGLVPKVAVAYAGTYATGQAALLWYSRGETLSRSALNKLYAQALEIGRQRTAALLARRKQERAATEEAQPRAARRRGLRRFLPGRRGAPPPEEK